MFFIKKINKFLCLIIIQVFITSSSVYGLGVESYFKKDTCRSFNIRGAYQSISEAVERKVLCEKIDDLIVGWQKDMEEYRQSPLYTWYEWIKSCPVLMAFILNPSVMWKYCSVGIFDYFLGKQLDVIDRDIEEKKNKLKISSEMQEIFQGEFQGELY